MNVGDMNNMMPLNFRLIQMSFWVQENAKLCDFWKGLAATDFCKWTKISPGPLKSRRLKFPQNDKTDKTFIEQLEINQQM